MEQGISSDAEGNQASGRGFKAQVSKGVYGQLDLRVGVTVAGEHATLSNLMGARPLSQSSCSQPCSINTEQSLVGLQLDTLTPSQMKLQDMLLVGGLRPL
jgi:hypothetical protein